MKTQILNALMEADALYVEDSPLITSFSPKPKNGQLSFEWIDEYGFWHECIIPEGELENVKITANGFSVCDNEGERIAISPYKLQKLW
jgi:hypothetical protein